MIYDVFISYSRRDMQVSSEICKQFRSMGLTCFTDRDSIPAGVDYQKILSEAIRKSRVFFYVASKESYDSTWSHTEIEDFFSSTSNSLFIACKIDDTPLPNDIVRNVNASQIYNLRPYAQQNNEYCCIDIFELGLIVHKATKQVYIEDDGMGMLDLCPSVFISHSHDDNEIAENIYNHLRSHGIRVWIDLHNIPPGIAYESAIVEGIENSSCIVVLYSRNVAKKSDQILKEINQADKSKKRIIPFLLDDTPMMGGFIYHLDRYQWIDASADINNGIETLTKELLTPQSLTTSNNFSDKSSYKKTIPLKNHKEKRSYVKKLLSYFMNNHF